MAYTREQINRISADRKASAGLIYVQDNGDKWIGQSNGRLFKKYTSDLTVGAQPFREISEINLREYLANLVTASNISRIKQVEVDFGAELYQTYKIFTITDDDILEGDFILANIAYDTPTGKSLDEIEMDEIICTAGNCIDGQFSLIVKSLNGSLRDKFKINYNKTWRL